MTVWCIARGTTVKAIPGYREHGGNRASYHQFWRYRLDALFNIPMSFSAQDDETTSAGDGRKERADEAHAETS